MITGGNIAAEWKRISGQWVNYKVETDFAKKTSAKWVAVFLAWIGTEACEAFQTIEIEAKENCAKTDKVMES